MLSLFETYKVQVMYSGERILFRLFQGPVKRIRIFLKPNFFTQIGLFILVTSQEDDKKVINSGGHRACFDVTMLTNTAV